MPKASKPGYYAVRAGRVPGIYRTWVDCEAQIKGFNNAIYKKLGTEAEAIQFVTTARTRDVAPVSSTSRPIVIAEPNNSTAEDEADCDIVYCDGACKGNGQPGSVAGIGVWWGHGDPRNISERCPGDQTNNRAELIAIVRILETTPQLKRGLLIKTDSNYSIQCVTSWIFNWMRNGFLAADGKPVKNRALIKYLAALLHARRKTSQTVKFKHVRGHVGIEGNEAADQLANLGAIKPTVPERDWETLEKQVLQSLKPVAPVKETHVDLKAFADGPLNNSGFAGLADINVDNVTIPGRESRQQHPERGRHPIQSRGSVSRISHITPRERVDATGSILPGPSDGIAIVHGTSKLPSGGSSRSIAAFTPSQKPEIVTSKEELEAYASCLLDDDELSALGKDGVFDSDF